MAKVAVLGGLLCTVGITSALVIRWDSVTLESELGHMITIGEFAIVFPKPLHSIEDK